MEQKKIKISFFNDSDYHNIYSDKVEFIFDADEFTNAMTLSVADQSSMSLQIIK